MALALSLPAALTLHPSVQDPGPRPAAASVSIQLALGELIEASSYVVVATAVERRSQWEELGGSKRIVTYTRLAIDKTLAGEPEGEIWVRTLGGVVGKIGQQVSGDARIALGSRSVLFLTKAQGAVVVAGMAQGHYPLVEPDAAGAPRRLVASPDAGALIPRPGPVISARERLVGITVDDAASLIARAWKERHATP